MSDRLKELQRQRALAQEQLAWLDGELARESGLAASPAPVLPPPVATPAPTDPAAAEAEAEALLAQYKGDPVTLQGVVKRGCYLYFLAALGLFTLGLLVFYFLHPHR